MGIRKTKTWPEEHGIETSSAKGKAQSLSTYLHKNKYRRRKITTVGMAVAVLSLLSLPLRYSNLLDIHFIVTTF